MIPTPNRQRRRILAQPQRERRWGDDSDIAAEIARRVSQTGARPEDWLSEKFLFRIVREKALEVLSERRHG